MTITTRPSAAAADIWRAAPAREATLARRGVVAAAHPLVSQTGIDVLRHGGNALDASIAAAALLMVVEPGNGHLGGDTFMLISNPANPSPGPSPMKGGESGGAVIALNGSGAAPLAATAEQYESLGGIPERGLLASSVPGTVHCWATALERFGTRPLSELLAPAIAYAEDGVPVSTRMHAMLSASAEVYRRFPDSARVFLPDGRVPEVGELLRQPDLAATLRRLVADGLDDFYRGALADELVSYSNAHGGLFARDDFARHATDEAAPITTEYRGHTIVEQPPVSQGVIVLLALNTLRQFDLAALGHGSAATLHLLIEAIKLAFEDRLRHLGDPRVVDNPLDWLLSDEHAREQAARIDPRRARPLAVPAVVQPDTTFMCLADESGRMVSYIHSLYAGSGVVMGSTGVLMNNRLRGFTLERGHPNRLAPGKRPVHTLNTYLVQRDGQTVLAGGTPGAHWQVQTNLQILTNVLDFGMDVQRAIEAPRFTMGGQTEAGSTPLRIESRAGQAVIDELHALGHPIEVVGPWEAGGSVQLIARDPASGLYQGTTEPRRPSCSVLGF
jgi:gamma-glutamyltranspeptidase/glutathione hydrolase